MSSRLGVPGIYRVRLANPWLGGISTWGGYTNLDLGCSPTDIFLLSLLPGFAKLSKFCPLGLDFCSSLLRHGDG